MHYNHDNISPYCMINNYERGIWRTFIVKDKCDSTATPELFVWTIIASFTEF